MGQQRLSKRSKKKGVEPDFIDGFSDENFTFIAGYTSGGVPFGLRHEELDNDDY